jgi:DNA primase catalytic core
MIPQFIIDDLLDKADIVDVLSDYITLTRHGQNYQACCPFHTEKTASFSVKPSKGIYKCFGCGKGGNAITFLIEHEKCSFIEAVKILAKKYKVTLPEEKEIDDEERKKLEEKARHREALKIANKVAADFFAEQLQLNEQAKDYAIKRMSPEIVEQFRIGYAPDGNKLVDYCRENGVKIDLLIELELVKERNGQLYDRFKNRLIFSIADKYGNPVGFTGRALNPEDEKKAKYMNSSENELFIKGNLLYGFHIARKAIAETQAVYLVEGNTDCTRLHIIGKTNTVAQMGTALTDAHIEVLRKAGAETFILLYDNDKAGKEATEKNAEKLLAEGFEVFVLSLPDIEKKVDADSFFEGNDFAEHAALFQKDYIMYLTGNEMFKATNPQTTGRVINRIAKILTTVDRTVALAYIEDLGKIYKPVGKWKTAFNAALREIQPPKITVGDYDDDDENGNLTVEQRASLREYGFYEEYNMYYFARLSGYGSNFVLRPISHIESAVSPKRLFEIINNDGISRVIEFQQKDLVSISAFKTIIEGLGNFLWKTDDICLMLLKAYLYRETETCTEITQIGWQKKGFWAWAGGVFTNEYLPVDKYGIVRLKQGNYYLPAFSHQFKFDNSVFQNERRFSYSDKGNITLNDYTEKLIDVFGENAIVGILFYINTLFRDVIVNRTNNYPILNLFGPKGAGKSEMCHSLLQFFGHHPKGPNINNTSRAALGDHIGQAANCITAIEEYKNSIEFEKIEFLKGLYDSTGRTKKDTDRDKKNVTTSVDCGVALVGQEMPTADIALYSRLLFVPFYKTEYNDAEKKRFKDLKELEKKGLTHITHELLLLRDAFIEGYDKGWEEAASELKKFIENEVIEERIQKNWTMILAGYFALKNLIELPFTIEKVTEIFVIGMRRQNIETKKGSDVANFWTIVEYLFKEGLIENEIDFRIDQVAKLKTDKAEYNWEEIHQVVRIDHTKIFGLYRKHAKQIIDLTLPLPTLDYYLKNSKEFLGKMPSVAFKTRDVITGRNLSDVEVPDAKNFEDTSGLPKKKYRVTSALCFDYQSLGINIHFDNASDDDIWNDTIEKESDFKKLDDVDNIKFGKQAKF